MSRRTTSLSRLTPQAVLSEASLLAVERLPQVLGICSGYHRTVALLRMPLCGEVEPPPARLSKGSSLCARAGDGGHVRHARSGVWSIVGVTAPGWL